MGFGVWGLGFRVWGLGFRVSGLGFRESGLGFGVSGFGFRVWHLGFGVGGLGFGVQGAASWGVRRCLWTRVSSSWQSASSLGVGGKFQLTIHISPGNSSPFGYPKP